MPRKPKAQNVQEVTQTSSIPLSHLHRLDYKDSFSSIFTFFDQESFAKEHQIWTYKWNILNQSAERLIMIISPYTSSNLTVSTGEVNPLHSSSTTDDLYTKYHIRSMPEYKDGQIQEFRITDDLKVERIIGNSQNEIKVVESQEDLQTRLSGESKEAAMLRNMSPELLEALATAKRREQGMQPNRGNIVDV